MLETGGHVTGIIIVRHRLLGVYPQLSAFRLYLFRFMFNLHCVILSAEQESLNIIYNTVMSG